LPKFTFEKHVQIVSAIMVIHNFVRRTLKLIIKMKTHLNTKMIIILVKIYTYHD